MIVTALSIGLMVNGLLLLNIIHIIGINKLI